MTDWLTGSTQAAHCTDYMECSVHPHFQRQREKDELVACCLLPPASPASPASCIRGNLEKGHGPHLTLLLFYYYVTNLQFAHEDCLLLLRLNPRRYWESGTGWFPHYSHHWRRMEPRVLGARTIAVTSRVSFKIGHTRLSLVDIREGSESFFPFLFF